MTYKTIGEAGNRMEFTCIGSKASPTHKYISEVDLLTDSKRSIRARQRIITSIDVISWENKSIDGKRYSKSVITIQCVFKN